MDEAFVIGVDVGTTSARAGVYDTAGRMLGRSQHPIRINRPSPEHAEHSSTDIWQAVGIAVRGAMAAAGVPAEAVRGISFDATCSLVVRATDGSPVSVSGADDAFDTIVWLDHRALAEAEACTATGHRVLDYIGGVMSPEMETPKLMWLKRHRPETWARAGLFLDLADFLTWKASGSTARSECTLTCKWTYLGHEAPGWQHDFFAEVGLGRRNSRETNDFDGAFASFRDETYPPCARSLPSLFCGVPARRGTVEDSAKAQASIFVVFPLMFAFLASATPVGVKMMTDMSSYLDFVLLLFFAFGVAFEVPVATVLLVATGLVKISTLKNNRGYVILGIFVVAAILTPPDAVSQCFMAVPMWILYEAGILFAQVLLRDKLKARAAEEAEAARQEAAESGK